MSTKTLRKRIALVAVAALSLGVISSVSPANAAGGAQNDTFNPVTVAFGNTTTTLGARVNNSFSLAIIGSGSTAVAAANTKVNSLTVAAAITDQPTGSAVNAKLTAADTGGNFDFAGAGLVYDINQGFSGINSDQSSTAPAQLNYTDDVNATAFDGIASGTTLATLSFTPTHVGTYKVTVWNETQAPGATLGATPNDAVNGTAASLSGADPYITFTIVVSAGVSTITLTPVNSTSVEDATYGSLVKVQIKDAAGNAAALAQGESVSIDPTGDGTVYARTAGGATSFGTTTGAAAGAAWSLTSAEFGSTGTAYVNIADATAETVSLVATLSSNSSVTASTSLVFKTRTSTAITLEPYSLTTGWAGATDTYTTPLASSITYVVAGGISVGSTSTAFGGFTLTDTDGKVSGLKGARYDLAANSVNDSTLTVAASFTAVDQAYRLNDVAGTDGVTETIRAAAGDNVITAKAVDISAATINGLITDTVAIDRTSLRISPAGTATFKVTVSNQFGDVIPTARVILSWAGRNNSTAATQVVGYTNADGVATLSYTDTAASTVTATSDTLTFTASDGTNSSTSTATVNWLATTVGTLTLTSTGDTDVVAGTTKTDISAAKAGATGTYATASALVKDANGVIIVGTPVTFTVAGLTGAEVHTTMATVYTDATGTAVAYISSYAAGKATVTATAGTVTATDDLYFSQQTVTEARTISATVSGNNVIATVKDRYGNTIEGVTVNATRVGTGFFGTGASTATGSTDKNGVIEFQYNGEGTVTVAFSTTTYGQSTSTAGYVGTSAVTAAAAGTTTANQTGLGAALAPAGVNSVSVAVAAQENAAQTAADAAAEATDAANAATDAANAAAEAADAATAAAQDAADAVAALSTQVTEMVSALKKQITSLTNLVIKIQKKVKA